MNSQPTSAFPLDAASREVLNRALEDSDLASCVVDAATRTAVVVFYVTSILPEDGSLEEAYPLCLVARPVGRVAVRHSIGGQVRPISLDGIDSVLDQFAVKYMDDWDIVDPPEQYRQRWAGEVSLDTLLGDEDQHLIELWQDELPQHGLDIAVWFDQLYVLDRELNPATPAIISAWTQRWSDAATALAGPSKSVSIRMPQGRPSLDLTAVLARTRR
jgi:hypothetical protein